MRLLEKNDNTVEKSNLNESPIKLKAWYYKIIVRVLVWLAKIRFNLKVDKSEIKDMDEPCIYICNHSSIYDPAFFCGGILPKPLNCVVAYNMFYYRYVGKLFKNYPVISKHQFNIDLNCIREIKRHLNSGISVLLFPEGRVTADGTTGYISPAIGKLIKLLGFPVVVGKSKGAYVASPKWGGHRHSPVSVRFEKLFNKEEVKTISAQDITDKIVSALEHNDNLYAIDNGIKIKGKELAKGLHKLLYKCPNCKEEFANISQGNKLICTKCGNVAIYNKNALITPENNSKVFNRVDLWFDYQEESVKKEVNESFEMTDKVLVLMPNDETSLFEYVGEGQLKLNYEGLYFDGEINKKPVSIFFDSKSMPTLAYVIGRCIDTFDGQFSYRFEFVDRLPSVKYVLAIEEIYRQKHSKTM